MNYFRKRTECKKILKDALDDQKNSFVYYVTYANISLSDRSSTPRVTNIMVRNLDNSTYKRFCIHMAAEKNGIDSSLIRDEFDQLENWVIEDFINFLENYKTCTWFCWDIENDNQGLEEVIHRFNCHPNTESEIKEAPIKPHILNNILQTIYGDNYCENPKLSNLIKANNM